MLRRHEKVDIYIEFIGALVVDAALCMTVITCLLLGTQWSVLIKSLCVDVVAICLCVCTVGIYCVSCSLAGRMFCTI